MPTYAEYFLASTANVVQFETLEISHPDFSQTFYVVRNARAGLTATLETDAEVTFTYYPLRIDPTGVRTDLDAGIQVQLGDLGELVPQEIDRIAAAGTLATRPTVVYRTFRSDDLTAPLYGPISLEMMEITSTREGQAFEARAPELNHTRTGIAYTADRFPTLRGLV